MTVKELIDRLSMAHSDSEVRIDSPDCEDFAVGMVTITIDVDGTESLIIDAIKKDRLRWKLKTVNGKQDIK